MTIDDLIAFMTRLFRKSKAPETPLSVQDEIKTILEKTAQDVASGTKRIEDQIEELKEIERRLFDDPEMTLKPVTEKVVGQEPLDELLADLAKKTGASQEEVRRVLIERANEGYLPGDPKRMLDEDDEMLRAYIQTEKLMNREEDLMLDILENAELPEDEMAGIRALAEEGSTPTPPPIPEGLKRFFDEDGNFVDDAARKEFEEKVIVDPTLTSGTYKDLGKTDVGIPDPRGLSIAEEVEEAYKRTQIQKKDLERAEELMMDPENIGKTFDEIMQMVQDEKVIPLMKFQPNPKPKKAEGGVISVDDLRTLNPGPRIPFASSEIPGSFEAQEEAMATREKYDSLSEEGKNLYNAYSLDNPGTDPSLIIDILQKQGFAFGGRVGFERGGGLTGLRPRHQAGTYDMVDAYRRKVLREMGGGEIRENAQLQEAMQQAQRKAELAEYKMLGSPALGMGAGRKMKRIYEPLLQAGYSPADLVDAETAAQIPTRVFQGNVEQFGRRRDEGEMNAAIARLHPGLARPSSDVMFREMMQRRRIPVENEQADLSEYMRLAGLEEGGRVGLQDGGGPKLTRRRLLQLMGAGIGSLFMPRAAKQVAESVAPAARVIKRAPGMPDWFPLLVNQIKSKGKITREPDYKDFTSGGDTTVRYKLKDDSLAGGEIFLEEDLQSGTVSIFGRGDDFQQVSMDYYPGARTATKKGLKEDPPTFEAGEFFKGEIQDFENIGVPTDDLRGGLLSWEKLSGFRLTPREKIQRMMKKFEDDYKDPNVEPDDDLIEMSQGGGVGSLFKQRNA